MASANVPFFIAITLIEPKSSIRVSVNSCPWYYTATQMDFPDLNPSAFNSRYDHQDLIRPYNRDSQVPDIDDWHKFFTKKADS